MKTNIVDGWVIEHQGTHHGKVLLKKVMDGVGIPTKNPAEIEVPASILLTFAADLARAREITALQEARYQEILGL